MDGYESTRRTFLKKIGLTLGATALATVAKSTQIIEDKIQFPLTEDQVEFMKKYDLWMDEFTEVIKARRMDPDGLEINKKLMLLSEQAQEWQPIVSEFMKDSNFAKHYMIATERMTNEI